MTGEQCQALLEKVMDSTYFSSEMLVNPSIAEFAAVIRNLELKEILEESKVQAKIVKNAARYLTGEAQEGAIAFGSTDNRKTYNNTSSVNLTGNNFYVRDEQDIRSLAVEIATLTRRQQRGRGLRMA